MLLGARHALNWIAMLDIINLVNELFNEDIINLSKYKLLHFFPEHENWFEYYLYCPNCKGYIGNRKLLSNSLDCPSCEFPIKDVKKAPYFLLLNVRSQLRELLENPLIHPFLDYRFNREKKNADNIEDIYDGQLYKSLSEPGKILSYKQNFSYSFNTDGCEFSASSNKSAWPVYGKLNELPLKLRNQHMFLIGIFVDDCKPSMNTFFQPKWKNSIIYLSMV